MRPYWLLCVLIGSNAFLFVLIGPDACLWIRMGPYGRI